MRSFLLRYIPKNQTTLAVILSIFIGILLNLDVYQGRFDTQISHGTGVSYFTLAGEAIVNVAFSFFFFRLLSLGGAIFFKICASIVVIASVCASYYITFFDVVIGYGILISVLTTDIDLSKEVVGNSFIYWVIGLSAIPLLLIWCSPNNNTLLSQLKNNRKACLKSILLLAVIAVSVYSYLKLMDQQQKKHEAQMNVDLSSYSGSLSYAYLPTNWIIPLVQYAITQYDDKFNENEIFDPSQKFTYTPDADNNDAYVVFIIGETARWDHMGLLGYSRQTNPLLSKEKNLVAFKGRSCDTATKLSLRCMFVREGGVEDNPQRTMKENNIFSVMKKLGFSSELFAMQGEVWFYNKLDVDNYLIREMITAKHSTYGKAIDDTLLIDEVHSSIENKPQGKHLIILHTKGSHYLYSKRYPKEFKQYQPECLNVDDNCSKQQLINAYDNSILYTDYFIDGVIDQLRDKKAIVFYTSDHGESINEGHGLHGTPREIAPEEQFRVPFVVWMSDSYLASPNNQQRFEQLKKYSQQGRPFYHHQIYDSILGCLGYTSADGGMNNRNNLCGLSSDTGTDK
ncbi:kdo(2)-lipid A phosphoethanolamine 7''-transferase [Moellerella wisconsensis]|uniref:kdo(2)-lipid A phosphoethanolamine 7''-transferase n=1 Tax=Moellerella wisconsensis TaxID=158849 RepID=UPI00241002A8|nr:kdo(2)-lipid A phosphoethanolamine 7''-transferase [Moellerella wisconsensis]